MTLLLTTGTALNPEQNRKTLEDCMIKLIPGKEYRIMDHTDTSLIGETGTLEYFHGDEHRAWLTVWGRMGCVEVCTLNLKQIT